VELILYTRDRSSECAGLGDGAQVQSVTIVEYMTNGNGHLRPMDNVINK
jgi:hypothetical protein